MKPTNANPATAYHEAGHACVAFLLKRGVEEVSITCVPNRSEGHVRLRRRPKFNPRDKRSRNAVEREVIIGYAGDIAEEKFSGSPSQGSSETDFVQANNDLGWHVEECPGHGDLCNEVHEAYKHYMYACAKCTVELQWPRIEALAEELLKHGTLSGRKAREIWKTA